MIKNSNYQKIRLRNDTNMERTTLLQINKIESFESRINPLDQ